MFLAHHISQAERIVISFRRIPPFMDIKIVHENNNVIFYTDGVALSSTISGGGHIRSIVFNTLQEYIQEDKFDLYINKILENYGLGANTPVFVTLVDINHMKIINTEDYLIAVTAGISEPASFKGNRKPGTINVMVIVKRKPEGNAMADMFRVATEAKSMAAFALGLKFGNIPSPGTVSDAVCVVFAGEEGIRYCGFGTALGDKIIESIYDSVYAAGKEYMEHHGHNNGT
ncbi:hypothetical protein FACI_IFERC00001G1896 [Ferroplasma acidarmanus Fer1]|jgi:adenosylcobinamide amidohydrolase|uniref:Adenosylcobinamide amidohydrolase n=2 Tax=Ferroplasma TaxID=74968 RepID=S0ASV7_FERAC|nr:hypothetical protein FACI_IFERC00001G1896 [Ferroplasma acidarmanus Fer1]